MSTLTIARRFCGPPASANGGYFCGCVANLAAQAVTVRLLKPPPLDTPLQVVESAQGMLEVRHADQAVGQARPVDPAQAINAAQVPVPLSHLAAVAASRCYEGFNRHPFPTCFVCGPQRERGDGLRIFPGEVVRSEAANSAAGRLVASPWIPDESLDSGDGSVRPQFMWAALDCPGYVAVSPDMRTMLLGELTAHIDRCARVGETYTVMGWHIHSEGRKHQAGTALFDDRGVLCAYARALWIEPRATS